MYDKINLTFRNAMNVYLRPLTTTYIFHYSRGGNAKHDITGKENIFGI